MKNKAEGGGVVEVTVPTKHSFTEFSEEKKEREREILHCTGLTLNTKVFLMFMGKPPF